jgi:hypothetical protein
MNDAARSRAADCFGLLSNAPSDEREAKRLIAIVHPFIMLQRGAKHSYTIEPTSKGKSYRQVVLVPEDPPSTPASFHPSA